MRNKATSVILTALIFATVTLTASAQIPLNMSYQARLADNTGNPVPDSSYDMEFRFYSDSTGGVPVWTESFFGLPTSNGFFDVIMEPPDLQALGGPLFLEIMVGDEIMSPRAPLASVPFSAISQRVQGDIITNEGYLVLTNADGDSSFSILSDAGTGRITVKMVHPPEMPSIEMSADVAQSSFKMMDPGDETVGFDVFIGAAGNSIKLMDPGDDSVAVIAMSVDPAQSSVKMIDPSDDEVGFDVFVGGEGNSIKLMDPSDDEVPAGILQSSGFETSLKLIDPSDDEVGFDVFIGTAGNSIKMMDPSDDENSLVEINGGIGGDINFKMFNPQPEPPAVLMEMSSSPLTGAGFKMFNPQPEPPAGPMLEMNTDQYGAIFAMTSPQMASPGDDITDPLFEVTADSTGGAINLYDDIGRYMGLEPMPFTPGGIFRMYDPVADAVKFEVTSNADGGGIGLYDDVGKYMGTEPSPFTPGGIFRMYDPVADAVKFEVYTSADGGGVGLYDDIGKYMGFEPSPFVPGGFVYLIDPSSGDTTISLDTHGYIQVDKGITLGPNANNGELNLVAGTGNTVNGWYNIVSGYGSQCDYNNNFIWSDYPVGPAVIPVQSSGNNQFLVRATGAVKFYTNANLTSGVQLTPGATSWSSITTLDGIRNLRPVDSEEILNKIEQLPINRYSYKSEDESVEHIGPMADDFYSQFGVGVDNQHISTQDQSGIALAGIKEMINIMNELKDKNAELERRIAELERKH